MRFSRFTPSDIPFLKDFEPPGWLPVAPRFSMFMQNPHCEAYKLENNGRLCAVGAVLYFGNTAWLATIITHPEMRNLGYGTAITRFLIAQVNTNLYQAIYLDATEMGYPVYKKLGFNTVCHYLHYKFETERLNEKNPDFDKIKRSDIPNLLALDLKLSGEDRSALMLKNIQNGQIIRSASNKILAYYLPEFFEGPVMATDHEAGFALLQYRRNKKPNAAFPESNLKVREFYESRNEFAFRDSRIMVLGKPVKKDFGSIFNRISGMLG